MWALQSKPLLHIQMQLAQGWHAFHVVLPSLIYSVFQLDYYQFECSWKRPSSEFWKRSYTNTGTDKMHRRVWFGEGHLYVFNIWQQLEIQSAWNVLHREQSQCKLITTHPHRETSPSVNTCLQKKHHMITMHGHHMSTKQILRHVSHSLPALSAPLIN